MKSTFTQRPQSEAICLLRLAHLFTVMCVTARTSWHTIIGQTGNQTRAAKFNRFTRRNGPSAVATIAACAAFSAIIIFGKSSFKDQTSTGAFNWHGIQCQFPKTCLVREAIYSDSILVRTNAYTFELNRDHIYVNGDCFGHVSPGDNLSIEGSRSVLVNGRIRIAAR